MNASDNVKHFMDEGIDLQIDEVKVNVATHQMKDPDMAIVALTCLHLLGSALCARCKRPLGEDVPIQYRKNIGTTHVDCQ